jgi:hypothetical protein
VTVPQPAAPHGDGGAVAGKDQSPSPSPFQALGNFSVQPAAPDAATPGGIAVAIRLEAKTDAHAGSPDKDASGGARERTPSLRDFQPAVARDAADATAAHGASARAGLWAPQEAPARSALPEAAETPAQPVQDLNPPDARFEPSPSKVSAPLKDLSIQVGQTPEQRVDLRVTERAGELRVAVRAADPEMAHSLRQGLPELVNRLEDHGFRTEAWRPAGIVSASGPPSEARESSTNPRNGDPQPQSGSSRDQGGPRDHSQSDRPKWVAELESSLEGGEER